MELEKIYYDLTTDEESPLFDAGYEGEHLRKELEVKIPDYLIRDNAVHRIVFDLPDGNDVRSPFLKLSESHTLCTELVQLVTKKGVVRARVEAFTVDEDGKLSFLGKSNQVRLEFHASGTSGLHHYEDCGYYVHGDLLQLLAQFNKSTDEVRDLLKDNTIIGDWDTNQILSKENSYNFLSGAQNTIGIYGYKILKIISDTHSIDIVLDDAKFRESGDSATEKYQDFVGKCPVVIQCSNSEYDHYAISNLKEITTDDTELTEYVGCTLVTIKPYSIIDNDFTNELVNMSPIPEGNEDTENWFWMRPLDYESIQSIAHNTSGEPVGSRGSSLTGIGSILIGHHSFGAGDQNIINGDGSAVFGTRNIVGYQAFAMGLLNTILSGYSFGKSNIIEHGTQHSFIAGSHNKIKYPAINGFILGTDNIIKSGINTTLIGKGLIGSESEQLVTGSYNTEDPTAALIVGIGTGDLDSLRKNALTVKKTGDVEVLGDITSKGVNLNKEIENVLKQSKEYTDDEIAKFDFILIVNELPTTGLPNRLYLVPKSDQSDNDLFDEYIWTNKGTEETPTYGWEWITTKQVEVDLSDYAKKSELPPTDQSYDPTSKNAQSGEAVAQAVENRVTFKDFAGKDGKPGVVYANQEFGIGINLENGNLYLRPAGPEEIDKKSELYAAIVPQYLDYAVKKSLTDNKESLTDLEKESIMNWLGVDTKISTTVDEATEEVLSQANEYTDSELATFDFIKIVSTLPETGLLNRLYLIPKSDTSDNDLFDEYMWVNKGTESSPAYGWEWITTKQVEVDLSDYVRKSELPTTDQTFDSTSKNAQSGIAVAGAVAVKADRSKILDYITYDITNNEVTILSCNPDISGNHIIPDTIEGYPVTSIGSIAFRSCTGLTSITIPNSVTSIDSDAFQGCEGLTSVTIGNGVTSIGDEAFFGCTGLTSITIPSSVKSIGYNAFYGCKGLKSVTIGNGVTSIDSAFYGCTGLTSVTIPDSVTSTRCAFYGCTSLTSITIPNSVTNIEDGTFYDCTSLTSITIPNSVTSIGYYAFYGCTSLTSITIPNSVTSISNDAFIKSNIKDIYYEGTEEQWQSIIDETDDFYNSDTLTIHYNQDLTTKEYVDGKLSEVDASIGDINTALDKIIEIQNHYISLGEQ